MSTITKHPISALPLPHASKLLIHNLTPDTATPSVSKFKKALQASPSVQRRSRILPSQSHFSHVTPFPLPFPYEIEPPTDTEVTDKAAYVEQWLSEREALHEKADENGRASLSKWYPKNRDQLMDLIGLSETGLRDCLPHLDVGDAFDVLGVPALAASDGEAGGGKEQDTSPVNAARQELVDVLGGHAVLMSGQDAETPFAPWSLRYSGHQFGVWAGQLGDGRAITVHATPHPSDPDTIYELQLKGGGRTPFSRSADGLAVVRSSIREYLCAEAMHALHIPTTRSLSLVSLPSLPVLRELREAACIVTRVAPSFLRIGSFEALNPPAQMFFIGGGQQEKDLDALRVLGEFVSDHVVRVQRQGGPDGAWGKELLLEVARRNARMVAGWQAYGFMHGVINTDNVSILGLTIDYGPYAFMDVFNDMHICNHSDGEGRYAYKYQPAMILFALRALLNALAPLVGAEAELGNKAISTGWANEFDEKKIKELRSTGVDLVEEELNHTFQTEFEAEYHARMNKRLGLRRLLQDDDATLIRPLLRILESQKLDFHLSFRHLTTFRPSLLAVESAALDQFVDGLLDYTSDSQSIQRDEAVRSWKRWLEKYAARIEAEKDAWVDDDAAAFSLDERRERETKAANPRFVLRQWVLEEVIGKVEKDPKSGKRVLAKVMQMACSPFAPWGAEGDSRPEEVLDEEVREERRLCAVGERKMLGFQCSCSS
ncbi:hypothetical protein HETIRDRAFT_315131 [Heterobasidion irregulare TC 32-1]|uniref:Selenoprotein O n=1 Tax=Heterobasidion irregulare (strain TC 32-1) TaxID=747525 RepID=W4KBB2_HETIT|nr:uncharacterized protein HETIRDRAFT_315131 [Heterobasidion irregulare TC 32-1]ETW83014.1 hypothetical protein HETIRDRAFT_315131 [Heterobasidion irregulare TC 32-1]